MLGQLIFVQIGLRKGRLFGDQICTTMLMESHWKVVKCDYLPKFFRPRLDLVTYIIISRLIPHHQQQFNKYQQGREVVSWRKEFKKEWISLSKRKINETYMTNIRT